MLHKNTQYKSGKHFHVNGRKNSVLIWQVVLRAICILLRFTFLKNWAWRNMSLMNNLWSCPSRAASSPRTRAPVNYHQVFRVAWAYSHGNTHTSLPCIITHRTVSTAIQQKQRQPSDKWDSDPGVSVGKALYGNASFHLPSLNQFHNFLSELIWFIRLFIFLEGSFLLLLAWHSLWQILTTSAPDPSSIRFQRREN